jgi:hypothetical protein
VGSVRPPIDPCNTVAPHLLLQKCVRDTPSKCHLSPAAGRRRRIWLANLWPNFSGACHIGQVKAIMRLGAELREPVKSLEVYDLPWAVSASLTSKNTQRDKPIDANPPAFRGHSQGTGTNGGLGNPLTSGCLTPRRRPYNIISLSGASAILGTEPYCIPIYSQPTFERSGKLMMARSRRLSLDCENPRRRQSGKLSSI